MSSIGTYGWSIWDDTAPHVDDHGNETWTDGTPWTPCTRPQDGPGRTEQPEATTDTVEAIPQPEPPPTIEAQSRPQRSKTAGDDTETYERIQSC